MAYAVGQASTLTEIMDLFKNFLESNGWAITQYITEGNGKKLLIQKNDLYFALRSASGESISSSTLVASITSGIFITGCLSGFDTAKNFNDQPGTPSDFKGIKTCIYCGASIYDHQTILGYHFIALSDPDLVILSIKCKDTILNTNRDFYPSLAFGQIDKNCNWQGGAFFTGTASLKAYSSSGYSGDFSPFRITRMQPLFSGRGTDWANGLNFFVSANIDNQIGLEWSANYSVAGYVYEYRSVYNYRPKRRAKTSFYGGNYSNSYNFQHYYLDDWYFKEKPTTGGWTNCYASKFTPTGASFCLPINIYIDKGQQTSPPQAPTSYVMVGRIPHILTIDNRYLQPFEQLIIDGKTYLAVPCLRKSMGEVAGTDNDDICMLNQAYLVEYIP